MHSVTMKVHFKTGAHSRKTIVKGEPEATVGRLPRVAKLMALAIRFEQLIRDGVVTDYADLARLGYVTRARITQIMNLLSLAPDIQEAILMMPPVESGKDPVTERELRPVSAEMEWVRQRKLWKSK